MKKAVAILTAILLLSIGCLEKKDKNPPYLKMIVSGSEGNNGWYVSNVTVFLNATDNESKIKELKYRTNGGTWFDYVMPVKLQKDGIYLLECYAKDGSGNEKYVNMTIKIDKTAPSISFLNFEPGYIYFRGKKFITPRIPRDTMVIGKYTVEVEASDALSGLEKVEFYIGDSLEGEKESAPFEFDLHGIGIYNITAVAYDYAGNYNSVSVLEVQLFIRS